MRKGTLTDVETGTFGRFPYVRTRGGGATIVVISGGDAFVRRFAPEVAARRALRIVRLFPPGSSVCILGYDTTAQACDASAIANEMAEAIRTYVGDAVTLAAISFGGFIATRLAAEHPKLVRNLILISTAHRFSEEGRRRVRQQMLDAGRGDFVAMARPFLVLFRRPWLNLLLRLGIRLRGGSLTASMNEPHFIVCMLEAALAAAEQGRDPLGRVAAETLLVAGTKDQFFDVAALHETAHALPSCELVLVANETHMLPLERPRRVAGAIAAFLERHQSRLSAPL